ncbi:GtrA family protein [Luteococcus peritonei]|uniref:GtrA family protein n=1 Tax=Luteococcus peritonei TaxID=88874 RepID=A0ABW4RWW3_9ACTN
MSEAPVTTEPVVESRRARSKRHLRQFVKFGIVGGSGVVVNMVVAFIMTKLHGGTSRDNAPLWYITKQHAFRYTHLVWIGAFLVANLWNFELNRRWTFKREHSRSWSREFWPFFAVGAVAAGAGLFIKTALTNPTSPFYLPGSVFNDDQGLRARAYWSQLITIVLTLPINFIVNKLWTFRAVKHPETGEDVPLVAPVVSPELVDEQGEPTVAALGVQTSGQLSERLRRDRALDEAEQV